MSRNIFLTSLTKIEISLETGHSSKEKKKHHLNWNADWGDIAVQWLALWVQFPVCLVLDFPPVQKSVCQCGPALNGVPSLFCLN